MAARPAATAARASSTFCSAAPRRSSRFSRAIAAARATTVASVHAKAGNALKRKTPARFSPAFLYFGGARSPTRMELGRLSRLTFLEEWYRRVDLNHRPLVPQTSALTNLSLIHISEPTRQAEISYAVFCLKKKKKK